MEGKRAHLKVVPRPDHTGPLALGEWTLAKTPPGVFNQAVSAQPSITNTLRGPRLFLCNDLRGPITAGPPPPSS